MAKSSKSSIVTKCALIMDILSAARSPLTFSEIVEQTGFVKSSCHRILAVLSGERLVHYDKATRKYRTGERLNEWSRSAWRRVDLQEIASTEMRELCDTLGINVALSVLDGNTILYLRTVDHVPLRYAAAMGDRAPLHCTAAGKVFLSEMSDNRRARLLDSLPFERMTENTKTSKTALLRELQSVSERGYALAIEEEFLNVYGAAAPILGEDKSNVACLSIWLTSASENAVSEMEARVPALVAASKRISNGLGWCSD